MQVYIDGFLNVYVEKTNLISFWEVVIIRIYDVLNTIGGLNSCQHAKLSWLISVCRLCIILCNVFFGEQFVILTIDIPNSKSFPGASEIQ